MGRRGRLAGRRAGRGARKEKQLEVAPTRSFSPPARRHPQAGDSPPPRRMTMVRARLRKGVLFSVAVAAALAPVGGPGAAAAPAPQPVSPSGVLAQLRQRSGPVAMGLPFGHEQGPPSVDRSLAPYLTIIGGNDGSEQVPLRSTSAVVDVAGV